MHHPHRRPRRVITEDNPDIGFQIAPMIDVVFVVLVFFMSQTLSIKIEQALNTQLPGIASSSGSLDVPNEQFITITADGHIAINDDHCGNPEDTALTGLVGILKRLKANGEASHTPLLVILQSEPDAPYHRTIDAMNALAAAEVRNVTFAVNSEDDT